jgi:hypothetical protein
MKQIVDYKIHNFPQIKDKKVKVVVEKLNLSVEKEVKLFS